MVYTGEWEHNVRSGRGTLVYEFSGQNKYTFWPKSLRWRDSHLCAESQAVSYTGEFRGDLPHGKGVIIYKSGAKYEGGVRRGLKHGRGVVQFTKSGEKHESQWVDDKLRTNARWIWHSVWTSFERIEEG